jgi:hypothetical protein
MRDEVLGFLGQMRERAVDLRQRLDAFNAEQGVARETMTRVITYIGQTVLEPGGQS